MKLRFLVFLFSYSVVIFRDQSNNDQLNHKTGKEEPEISLTPFSGQFPPVSSLKAKTGDAATLHLRLLTSGY